MAWAGLSGGVGFCRRRTYFNSRGTRPDPSPRRGLAMKIKSKAKGALALALALSLAACAPVTVTGDWRAPEYAQRAKKVLVVGVFELPLNRRSMEDALAEELGKEGVRVVTSCSLMPGDKMPEGETFRREAEGLQVDAVLVTRLVDVEKETVFVPPRARLVPHPFYYRRLYTYYGHAYYTIYDYEPGYVVERSIVSLETNLYDARTDRLVWSLATESFDPQNTKELVEPLARLITERLKKEKLI